MPLLLGEIKKVPVVPELKREPAMGPLEVVSIREQEMVDGRKKVQSPDDEYSIHSLEKLRIGGLWNIYGSNCHICAGKASLAKEYAGLKVKPSWHNILEKP